MKISKRGENAVSTTMFGIKDVKIFHKQGTEQVRQILCPVLPVDVLCIQDCCIEIMLNIICVYKECPLTKTISSSHFRFVVLGGTKKPSVGLFRFLAKPTFLRMLFFLQNLHIREVTRKKALWHVTDLYKASMRNVVVMRAVSTCQNSLLNAKKLC